mmetsp:Transcript_7680/g.8450  ORF Transcript_7680/g.8450 Transcript_7680/m.8450 type:complete len:88 (+) Transcript_7680:116-379(+)
MIMTEQLAQREKTPTVKYKLGTFSSKASRMMPPKLATIICAKLILEFSIPVYAPYILGRVKDFKSTNILVSRMASEAPETISTQDAA